MTKAFIFFVSIFVFSVCTLAADDNVTDWLSPAAEYRLDCIQKGGSGEAFVDDRRICFPALLENGAEVYDENAVKLESHLYSDGGLLVPPSENDRRISVYFGFDSFSGADDVKDVKTKVSNKRLVLYQSQHNIPLTPDKWLGYEINHQNGRVNNSARNSKLFKNPCKDERSCRLRKKNIAKHPQAVLPFCARCTAFVKLDSSGGRLPLLSRPPLWSVKCCRPLLLLPDYGEMMLNHSDCTLQANKRILRNFIKLKAEVKEKIAEARKTDPAEGLTETLRRNLSESNPRSLETPQVYLSKRPFDTFERFTVYFKGMLFVPEKGKYLLKVRSNSTRILWIDGKVALRTFGETDSTQIIGTDETVEVELEKGVHELLLCYHKENVPTFFFAGWKKSTDEKFVTLSEENFSPAYPAEAVSLSSKDGRRFPIILRDDKFDVFTSKLERAVVNTFAVPEGNPDFTVKANDGAVSENQKTVVLSKDSKITLQSRDENFSPLEVANYPRTTPRISVHPDLALNLWLPPFIYDDESLDMTIETSSRLPFRFTALLAVEGGGIIKSFTKLLKFEDNALEHEDRFAADFIKKEHFVLNGAKIPPDGKNVCKAVLSMPGMIFDEKKFRTVSVSALETLSFVDGRLTDAEDACLTILLHRPALAEKRTWELPKQIAVKAAHPKKVLLVCGGFGEFTSALKERFSKRGIELEVLFWNAESATPSASSLPALFERMTHTDADAILLIPNTVSERGAASMRDELRILAFVSELARRRTNAGRIILATPFPSRSGAYSGDEELFSAELRNLKRDYALDFIELSAYLKKDGACTEKNFIIDDGLYSVYPVKDALRASEYIDSNL